MITLRQDLYWNPKQNKRFVPNVFIRKDVQQQMFDSVLKLA